jgi:hypothetical protein
MPALTIDDLLDLKEEPTVVELLDVEEPAKKQETPHKNQRSARVRESRRNRSVTRTSTGSGGPTMKLTLYEARKHGSDGGGRAQTVCRLKRSRDGWRLETLTRYTNRS